MTLLKSCKSVCLFDKNSPVSSPFASLIASLFVILASLSPIFSYQNEIRPRQYRGRISTAKRGLLKHTIRAIDHRAAISKAPSGSFTVSNDGDRVKRKCMKQWRIHALFHPSRPVMSYSLFRSPARHNPRFLHSKTHIAAMRPQGLDIAPAETRRHTPAPLRG